jgi:hypothetical protein
MKFSRGDKVFIRDTEKLSPAARKILSDGAAQLTGTFRGCITVGEIIHAIVTNDKTRGIAFVEACLISPAN